MDRETDPTREHHGIWTRTIRQAPLAGIRPHWTTSLPAGRGIGGSCTMEGASAGHGSLQRPCGRRLKRRAKPVFRDSMQGSSSNTIPAINATFGLMARPDAPWTECKPCIANDPPGRSPRLGHPAGPHAPRFPFRETRIAILHDRRPSAPCPRAWPRGPSGSKAARPDPTTPALGPIVADGTGG